MYELYMNCFCIINNLISIIVNFIEEKRGIYSFIIVLILFGMWGVRNLI